MSRTRYFLLRSISAAILFSFPASAFAACSNGERPATASDLTAMTAAGIPNAAVGMCYNPSSSSIGAAAGEAKAWLQQHSTKDANVGCFNPQFAEKLMKFMQAVPGGVPNITSGYRGLAEQQKAMASGASRVGSACGSYHLYGLAADFNNNSSSQTNWMRANAGNYGIKTIGAWDPNHFQDANGRSGQCGSCTNESYGALPSQSSNGATGAPFSQQVHQALAPQQQQAQQPIQSSNPAQSYTPQTSSDAAGIPVSNWLATTSVINYNTNTNTNTSSTTNASSSATSTASTTPLSAWDQIMMMANPDGTTAGSVATASSAPVSLNNNLSDGVALTPGTPTDQTMSASDARRIQSSTQGPAQTFTSNDLQDSPALQSPPANTSFFVSILQKLKLQLIALLAQLKPFLTPFGGNLPSTE